MYVALVAESACCVKCVFEFFAWVEDFAECSLWACGRDCVLCSACVCPEYRVSLFYCEVCWVVRKVFDADLVCFWDVSCFEFDIDSVSRRNYAVKYCGVVKVCWLVKDELWLACLW